MSGNSVPLLFPEDVPGAVFKAYTAIEDHSVTELQRWLECRAYKRTGCKSELVERVKNCMENGQDQKIFAGVDNGKWYDMKRNLSQNHPCGSNVSDALDLSSCIQQAKWGRFPSYQIPKYFNKGHIYTYLFHENIENEEPDLDQGIVTTIKPFRRGTQYVDSDHITLVFDSVVGKYYLGKCKVQASFQKKVEYDVTVALHKTTGAIIKGLCQCKQSALGKCSHISAFLNFLARYVDDYGIDPVSSTSKEREWGIGAKKRDPGPIRSKGYTLKRYKTKERSTFDPRPLGYKREFKINNFIVNLQKVETPTMFETILQLEYDDFQYSQDEINVIKLQSKQFLSNMVTIINALNCTTEFCEIPNTAQDSENWYRWRTHFITSSNIKLVCGLQSENAKKNFLLTNLWRYTPSVLTAAMQYGKRNEPRARNAYGTKCLRPEQIILQVGLVVNKKYPFCATSIDGLVMNPDGNIDHIIEIKCPKVLENCKNVRDFDTFLTKAQCNNFFLRKHNNEICIKKYHPYLYQILTSLLIFEIDLCNLVIWCPSDMLVISVNKNDYIDIINEIKTKVSHFYKNVYVAEIFTMRSVRALHPVDTQLFS